MRGRGMGDKRIQREKHIARKKRIVAEVYGMDSIYKHDGCYSKGKIHCSCPLCREKRRDGCVPLSEKKKLDSMDQQILEYVDSK